VTRRLSNGMKKLLCGLLLAGAGMGHAGSYDDFFRAVRQDNFAKIQELLSRGFDANTPDPKGQSALGIALSEETLQAAKTLIDWHQTDVNKLNAADESPLMLAALKGHLDLAEMLVKKGADINKTGWAPLHYAASGGHLPIIKLLLENSAYIDAESPNGTTPLMMAAMYGTPAAVNLLLEEGADATLKNEQGLTALQFAQRASRPDSTEAIAAFLRSKLPAGQW
jgi:ankyrin repeat protein